MYLIRQYDRSVATLPSLTYLLFITPNQNNSNLRSSSAGGCHVLIRWMNCRRSGSLSYESVQLHCCNVGVNPKFTYCTLHAVHNRKTNKAFLFIRSKIIRPISHLKCPIKLYSDVLLHPLTSSCLFFPCIGSHNNVGSNLDMFPALHRYDRCCSISSATNRHSGTSHHAN